MVGPVLSLALPSHSFLSSLHRIPFLVEDEGVFTFLVLATGTEA